MATPNTPSVGTEAEYLPAPGDDAGYEAPQPGDASKGGGRRDKSFWLDYTLIGASIVTIAGVLISAWGGAQNNLTLLLVGVCLFCAGSLGWLGVFAVLTWWLARDTAPLVGRLVKGIRNLFSNTNPDVVEK